MKNNRFKNLFSLIKDKVEDPETEIDRIKRARQIVSDEIDVHKIIKAKMNEIPNLMRLLCDIPSSHEITAQTVNLLVEEAIRGNGNGDGTK